MNKILKAIKDNNLDEIKNLVEVEQVEFEVVFALLDAITLNHKHILDYFIIRASEIDKKLAFLYTCKYKCYEMYLHFLENNYIQNINFNYGCALAVAISSLDFIIINDLIEKGSIVEIHHLEEACSMNSFSLIKLLIHPNIFTRQIFKLLYNWKDIKIINYLLKENYVTLYEVALLAIDEEYNGDLEIVKFCINNGLDVHTDKENLLLMSIINKNYHITKYLLEERAFIDHIYDYPAFYIHYIKKPMIFYCDYEYNNYDPLYDIHLINLIFSFV